MPSVWDDPSQFISFYDVKTGKYRAATPGEAAREQQRRAERNRQARWDFLKTAALGSAGVVAGGYGLAALTGGLGTAAPAVASGLSGTAPAPAAVPAGWTMPGVTAPTWGAPAVAPAVASTAAPAAASTIPTVASTAGKFFTGRDLMQFAVPAASNLLTTYLGNRSANRNADAANAQQQAQFEATQKFLAEQEARAAKNYEDMLAEQKRQFDATEAEKLRQWQAMEPWREAGRGNLVRMNSLLDEPRPQRVAYQPTFTS